MRVKKALVISDDNIERLGELSFVAHKLADTVDALVFTEKQQVKGNFDNVYGVKGLPFVNLGVVEGKAKEYDLVLTNGFIGASLGGRLAYKLKAGCVFGVTEIDFDEFVFSHPIYGDKAIARYKLSVMPAVVILKEKYFEQEVDETEKSVEWLTKSDADEAIKVIKEEKIKKEAELDKAKIVVGGGRGIGSKEGFEVLKKLADLLGGTIGASRAAVDNGWISSQYQIGQSGVILSANLYFAFGISGATQHLAGIKNVKCVVAVNTDEEAPIFKRARFNIIADWKSFANSLIKELEEMQNA